MTKHFYEDRLFTGVVALGKYTGSDIRDGLKRFRDPFDEVRSSSAKWIYSDSSVYDTSGIVVSTVSYEGSHFEPKHILVSTLGLTENIDANSLELFLDVLLSTTGIREVKSFREEFLKEPFAGWELVSSKYLQGL